MKIRNKFALLTGTAMSFAPMSVCSIGAEGEGDAGGGGSSGGDQSADGNAGGSELSNEQSLEKEFYDPNEAGEDDGSSDGAHPGEDPGSSESDEDDDGEGGEGADGDNGDESGDEGEGEAGEKPKKPSRAQERFDELTANSRHHEREAEKWRNEAVKLGYVEGAEDDQQVPEEPDPEKYSYGEHDPEYLKDKGKYDAKVEMMQGRATARFKAEASALDAKWTKNLAEKAEAYPDFDEVVVKGAANWACPPVIAIAIKDSDVGPDIAYQLAKDPAEALRISKLTPLEQAREFGRKESALTSSKEVESLKAEIAKLKGQREDANGKPKPPARIVSKAPEPPRRRVAGGGARSETPADTNDFAAFERMADKKMGLKK